MNENAITEINKIVKYADKSTESAKKIFIPIIF